MQLLTTQKTKWK